MDSIRAGPSADRAPSPVDLVRYCRQQIETPVPVMDAQRQTSPTSGSGQPLTGPAADTSVEHRLRLLASSTDSTCVNPPISPHSLCGLSPDSADMFQGGLFHPKHPHLSPFVDDFRQAQQYPKSNVWCYPTVVEDNVQSVADLSYFTDEPCMEETGGLAPIHPGEIRKKSSDKTPMCLIADLARYNDVPHQYKLINEGGPAHQKIFTVQLSVGEGNKQEEYVAQGASIKKAQQAAAKKALEETKLPKRPPRFNHKRRPTATTYGYCSLANASLTPTVMLNALAMKIGTTPEYTFLNSPFPSMHRPVPIPPPSAFHNPLRFSRGASPFSTPPPPPTPPFSPFGYPPPLPYPRFPPVLGHYVKLKVGTHEFVGYGPNRQLAKHEASLKALRVLEPIVAKREQQDMEKRLADKKRAENGEEPEANGESTGKTEQASVVQDDGVADLENGSMDNKSPINMVYEFALRRRMDVNFEVVSETGPPHKRHFIVCCIVNSPGAPALTTQGEGASKKLAKHDAAEKMMQHLKTISQTLPPPMTLRQQQEQQAQQKAMKEKRRKTTIIKDLKSDPSYGQEINPVSRLIQVLQTKKQSEPVFEFVGEDGHARCKEFIMKVTVGDKSREGRGPNKKLAKRAAAENMLEAMGYAKPLPTPGKPVLKHRQSSTSESSPDGHASEKVEEKTTANEKAGSEEPASSTAEKRKVKFQLSDEARADGSTDNDDENRHGGYRFGKNRSRSGRRLAPGVFFLPSAFADCDFEDAQTTSPADGGIAGQSETESFGTWSESRTVPSPASPPASDSAREQLGYLANLLSFQVQFTDFPKSLRNGENGEYLSLVSLSTTPPLVCHGSGPTIQQAQNDAALGALRSLADKGLQMALDAEDTVAKGSATGDVAVKADGGSGGE